MKMDRNRVAAALSFAALAGTALGATSALAADLGWSAKDVWSKEAASPDWRGWMVRGRVLGVIPDEDSSNWTGIAGAGIAIDDAVIPELDISYFFNRNIALELVLGVTRHEIDGRGTLAANGQVGDVWLLPPTLMLQYHFQMDHGIKPYLGAGLNYTLFFNEDAGPAYASLDLDNSFGLALQAGVDIHLQGNWYFNIDLKKVWMETDASVNGGAVTANVDVDPWIGGVGLGYRFGADLFPLH